MTFSSSSPRLAVAPLAPSHFFVVVALVPPRPAPAARAAARRHLSRRRRRRRRRALRSSEQRELKERGGHALRSRVFFAFRLYRLSSGHESPTPIPNRKLTRGGGGACNVHPRYGHGNNATSSTS